MTSAIPELADFERDESLCDALHPFRAAPWPAAVSDIPTLIFTGEFDIQTHRSYGAAAARSLRNSQVVEIAGAGHGAGMGDECTRSIGREFLTNPLATVDARCLSHPFASSPTSRRLPNDHPARAAVHNFALRAPPCAGHATVDAFPEDTAPGWMHRDRDRIYGDVFQRRLASMGIAEVVSAPASPWQNPYAERLIGSVRRECLNHVIVLGERHL